LFQAKAALAKALVREPEPDGPDARCCNCTWEKKLAKAG